MKPLGQKEKDRLAAKLLRDAADFLDPPPPPTPPTGKPIVDLPEERERRKRPPAA